MCYSIDPVDIESPPPPEAPAVNRPGMRRRLGVIAVVAIAVVTVLLLNRGAGVKPATAFERFWAPCSPPLNR